MKKLPILVLSLFVGCSEHDGFVDSFGTKLEAIEFADEHDTWTESYFYDANDRLITVENSFSLGKRYEIEYEDERVLQFTTYRIDNNQMVFRDSIEYTSDEKIKTVYNFSANSGEDLPLSWVYEYVYDSLGMLSHRTTFFKLNESFRRVEKYYWHENNLQKVEQFDENETLMYEYFYEYDDKKNYKKDLPIYLYDPVNWSANNVTINNYRDYVMIIDRSRSPCTSAYKYNLDGFPVEVKTNWGRKLKLKFK